MKSRPVIVDGLRTPFAKAGTNLAELAADELGRVAVNALLTRTGLDPRLVDEVIFGCVAQPPDAANVARVIALRAGIPKETPAFTVHRNCASGCEAITQACDKIAAGRGEIYVVGGVESMSQIPLLFCYAAAKKFSAVARARSARQKLAALAAFRPADFFPRAGLKLGLTDPVCGLNMGETAELLAREWNISREEEDAFALQSHRRALFASGLLSEEICPVYLNRGSKSKLVTADNGPRPGQSLEALAKLQPVFEKTTGVVTAGNSSQITDGAAALLVMTEKRASDLGMQPLGVVTGYEYAGCDPARMGLGPVYAIAKAEEALGLGLKDADLVEINEAFAAQVLAVLRAMKSEKFCRKNLRREQPLGEIPGDKLNVNGGAIALGHPVGATGARLVLTALKELGRRKGRRALVSVCVGGGQGAALWLERL